MNRPEIIQRIEGAAIAALAFVAVVVLHPAWWWVPIAAFLLFDLSALGYLRSTRAGSIGYNLVHTYLWPALAAAVAVATTGIAPTPSMVATLVAASWAVHVGVDRALGYGLKLPDAFTHTHLGWIGKDRGRGSDVGGASSPQ